MYIIAGSKLNDSKKEVAMNQSISWFPIKDTCSSNTIRVFVDEIGILSKKYF
jgi:hypothetical protein